MPKNLYAYAAIISTAAGIMACLMPLAIDHGSIAHIALWIGWGVLSSLTIFTGMLGWSVILNYRAVLPAAQKPRKKIHRELTEKKQMSYNL